MAGSRETQWIVTAAPGRSVLDLAADLRRAGFRVDQVLDAIGSITGTAEPASIAQVRAIDGVADVAMSHDVDVGPPGKDTTW